MQSLQAGPQRIGSSWSGPVGAVRSTGLGQTEARRTVPDWIGTKLIGPDRSAPSFIGPNRGAWDRTGADPTHWTTPNGSELDRVGRHRTRPCGLDTPVCCIPRESMGSYYFRVSWPQAIVLSHSRAPIEERMPYHGIRLDPVKPVIFMGRSAHELPTIEVRMAMYCFYRDLGIETSSSPLSGCLGSPVRAVRRTA